MFYQPQQRFHRNFSISVLSAGVKSELYEKQQQPQYRKFYKLCSHRLPPAEDVQSLD